MDIEYLFKIKSTLYGNDEGLEHGKCTSTLKAPQTGFFFKNKK